MANISKDNQYILGLGKVFIGVIKHKTTGIYAIKIEKPIEGNYQIGEDVLGKEIESEDPTYIVVRNLEGLAVLEKSIKYIREKLEQEIK